MGLTVFSCSVSFCVLLSPFFWWQPVWGRVRVRAWLFDCASCFRSFSGSMVDLDAPVEIGWDVKMGSLDWLYYFDFNLWHIKKRLVQICIAGRTLFYNLKTCGPSIDNFESWPAIFACLGTLANISWMHLNYVYRLLKQTKVFPTSFYIVILQAIGHLHTKFSMVRTF